MRTLRDVLLSGLLLSLLLAACPSAIQQVSKKSTSEGKVQVSIQIGDIARTVLPVVNPKDIDHYELSGILAGGGGETTLAESFAGSTLVSLDLGIWDFTVKGFKEDGTQILEGILKNQKVDATTSSVTFSLKLLSEETTGSIDITIELPEDSGIRLAALFVDGVDQHEITEVDKDNASLIHYTAPSVAAGDYYYVFKLENNEAAPIAVVSTVVQVRGNLCSKDTIKLTRQAIKDRPAAPASLRFGEGDGKLLVTWKEVPTVENYEVYYSPESTRPNNIAQTVSTYAAVIDGLTNGTLYYVWVRATNPAGSSDFASGSGTPKGPSGITIELAPQKDAAVDKQFEDILQGDSSTFSVEISNGSLQWYLDGSAISGATDRSYILDTTSMSLGLYELTVIVNDDGERLSGGCFINVVPNPTPTISGVGVYVDSLGVFSKTAAGGIIYGSEADDMLKNTAKDGSGYAVYHESSPAKVRDVTVKTNEALGSSDENWTD